MIDNAIEIEKDKKNTTKKVFKIIGKVFSYILLGMVLVIFGFSIYSKASGNTMSFSNSSLVVIASGSMSEKNNEYVKNNSSLNNQFDTYDIIGISKYDSIEEVKLYDVIAFKNKKDVTIVHRIVKIFEEDGKKVFLTQGDTNLAPDNTNSSQYSGYLDYDKVIGYYNGTRMKGIGIFVIFLQSPAGIVTIVSIVYCLLMFDHYSSKYKKSILDRTNFLVKLIDYDLSKPLDKEKIQSKYQETLHYQNHLYTFEDGKFISKVEKQEDDLKNKMIFKKMEDGKITITITDTLTKEEKVFENCSEEEAENPLSLWNR